MKDNEIVLEAKGTDSMELYLDRHLVEMDRPVTVRVGERKTEHKLRASLKTLLETLLKRGTSLLPRRRGWTWSSRAGHSDGSLTTR